MNAPRRVEVELDAQGRPAAVRLRQDGSPATPNPSPWQDGRTAENGNAVVDAIGEIWRVDDEWWRKPISRRYVEVLFEGGKHVVLYQDLITGEWFQQRL